MSLGAKTIERLLADLHRRLVQAELDNPKIDLEKQQREATIQAHCGEWLTWDGWRHLRTDPVSDRDRGKGFGELGMADDLFLRPCIVREANLVDFAQGEILWIEWKKRGGKRGAHQVEWHRKERNAGFLTVFAGIDFTPTIDGFKAWYLASGLAIKPPKPRNGG